MEPSKLDTAMLLVKQAIDSISTFDIQDKINAINLMRLEISKASPLRHEPIDCVIWINSDLVEGNEYNPNNVAPVEMKLLEHSIREDGYTQPIVTWRHGNSYEVIDGFHRHSIGKNIKDIRTRVNGYLPVTIVNEGRTDKKDRIASTIRHNRARGKHQIDAMSDIVLELSRRKWSDEKIAEELGMDADEILRLKQITGLAELFRDEEFSQAWEVES